MGFGVIYAEGFDRNQDMTSSWLRVRQFLNHQAFEPTETIQNNYAHVDTS
jgi:hypothetical protein